MSSPILDARSFPHFASFLVASQEYARDAHYRLLPGTFRVVDGVVLRQNLHGEAAPNDVTLRFLSAPVVQEVFATLRNGGDDSNHLLEDLHFAWQVVVSESIRKMLVTTCKELGMFPPSPPPAFVGENDCAYFMVSASFPAIAQRLYNNEVRNLCEQTDGVGRAYVQARTASFLLDVAESASVSLPAVSQESERLLAEFKERVAEWQRHGNKPPFGDRIRNLGLQVCVFKANAGQWFGRCVGLEAEEAPQSSADPHSLPFREQMYFC